MFSIFQKLFLIFQKLFLKKSFCKETNNHSKSSLLATHQRSSIAFTKGRGAYLYSDKNEKYLDFCAGIAVNAFGHCPRFVNKALFKQAKKLWHVSNLYTINEAEDFAKMITKKTFAKKVFFANSGAEAMEAVIKIIRRYHYINNNPHKNRIITFAGSFHGRTIATVCAAGNLKYMEGFAPHLDGFDNIEYGDIETVKKAITKNTAGIIIEPIQGEGGVNFSGFEFLKDLRELCDKHNILLALDEVQCGNSRTGKLFAYQHANIIPDIVATAKGIGNGFPLGVVMCTEEVSKAITPGTHGTTFGANPLAMSIGMCIFKKLSDENFLKQIQDNSKYLHDKLTNIAKKHSNKIIEIKGFGLMLGIRINQKYKHTEILEKLRDNKLLLATAGTDVIRLLPPLIITKKHIDKAILIIDRVFNEI